MNNHKLYATTPEEAVKRYLEEREDEVSVNTLNSHEYRIGHFLRWCKEEGIDNMNDLNGRSMQDYRHWRKRDGGLNNVSLHTQMQTFRVFIQWAEDYNAVTPELSEKIRVPELDRNENVGDNVIEPERAKETLEHYAKYQYASRWHTMYRLIFRTGIRIGGLRALDLSDYDSEGQYIEVRHRPDQDTNIKNGLDGERPIYINETTAEILDDYIHHYRHDVTDKFGREPLITTSNGRPARTTIRNAFYKMNQPCRFTGECPHDEEIETCIYRSNVNEACKCPSTEAPHAVRKASITHWRKEDTPAEQVSERVDTSVDTIERHYDKRTDLEKMEQRKEAFEKE